MTRVLLVVAVFTLALDVIAGQVRIKTSTLRSASAGRNCTSGCSQHTLFSGLCSARTAARPGSHWRCIPSPWLSECRSLDSWEKHVWPRSRGLAGHERGWWGDNPPYHVPVFVLTHHPRRPIEMEGGTTFHFITGGSRDSLLVLSPQKRPLDETSGRRRWAERPNSFRF